MSEKRIDLLCVLVLVVLFSFAGKVPAAPSVCSGGFYSTTGGHISDPGEGIFDYFCGGWYWVTATADPHYHFEYWAGSGAVIFDDTNANPGWFKPSGNFKIQAVFDIDRHDLVTSSTTGGSVVSPGEGTFEYDYGEVVTLEAEADDHYSFTHWSGSGGFYSTSNPVDITINQDRSAKAHFEIDQHTLVVSSTDGGSVISPGEGTFEYDYGEVVTLEAKADPGYHFTQWLGSFSTRQNPTTITMNRDYRTQAIFDKDQPTFGLTISSTAGGSVTLPGEGTFYYESGTEVSLKAEASDPNYTFFQWTGPSVAAGKVADAYAPEITVIVDGNSTLMAEFSKWDPNAILSEELQDAIKDRIQEHIEQEKQKRSEQAAQIQQALSDEYARLKTAFENQPDYPVYKKDYDEILSQYEMSSKTDQDHEDAVSALEALTTRYQYMMDAAIDQAKIDLTDVRAKVENILDDEFEVTPDLCIVSRKLAHDFQKRDIFECTCVDPLTIPQNAEASDGLYSDKIKVTWDLVECAEGYFVYRRQTEPEMESWPTEPIGSVDKEELDEGEDSRLYYYDDTAGHGCTYEYRIRAWNRCMMESGDSEADSGFVNDAEILPLPLDPLDRPDLDIVPCPSFDSFLFIPTGVQASDGEYESGIIIDWNLVPCAVGYEVWRNTNSNQDGAMPLPLGAPNPGIIRRPPWSDIPPAEPTQKNFWYWIKAVNSDGEVSGFSDPDEGYVTGPYWEALLPPYDSEYWHRWWNTSSPYARTNQPYAYAQSQYGCIRLISSSIGCGYDQCCYDTTRTEGGIRERPEVCLWGDSTLKIQMEIEAKCSVLICGDRDVPEGVISQANALVTLYYQNNYDLMYKHLCDCYVIAPSISWYYGIFDIETDSYGGSDLGDCSYYEIVHLNGQPITVDTEIMEGEEQIIVAFSTFTETISRVAVSRCGAGVAANVKVLRLDQVCPRPKPYTTGD